MPFFDAAPYPGDFRIPVTGMPFIPGEYQYCSTEQECASTAIGLLSSRSLV